MDKKKYKRYFYCGNCGKHGHLFKKCPEPIMSMGIIAFNIDRKVVDPADSMRIMSTHCSQIHDLQSFFEGNGRVFKKPTKVNDDAIKFLLIRRKNSLGYMEFIRGRYEIDNLESINKLLKQMVPEELEKLPDADFDKLWNSLWANKNKQIKLEYKVAKEKFLALKNNESEYSLKELCQKTKPYYLYPEWGFPKGRRNLYEKNLNCALREFSEETGLTHRDIQIMDKLNTSEEIFKGTNGVPYKHIYYIGHCLFKAKTNINQDNHEIGDIGWFTLKQANKLFRERHSMRKQILISLHKRIKEWLLTETPPTKQEPKSIGLESFTRKKNPYYSSSV